MNRPFSELSDAEAERLAILLEELGEAQQCIGKILRHGYDSYNPVVDTGMTNRRELERELGDVYEAILMLCRAKDVNEAGVNARQAAKHESIQRWLHHQPAEQSKAPDIGNPWAEEPGQAYRCEPVEEGGWWEGIG